MGNLIDLACVETAPFDRGEERATWAAFVGRWSGSTKLWLDPSREPEETSTALHAELILGGRWLRMTTRGVSFGKPHAGEMLLGFHTDTGELELAWIDSAHTGSAIMLSRGKPRSAGVIDVLGGYVAGDERWGWRSVLRCPTAGELLIEAFNVTPAGVEERAMESRLTREPEP